jgi:hypothetical protein
MQHKPVSRVGEDEGGGNRESQLKVSQAGAEGNIEITAVRQASGRPSSRRFVDLLLVAERDASAWVGVVLFPGQLKLQQSILVVGAVSG